MSEIKYKNPKLPIEKRINDLLGRMTLNEKVGQLMQCNGAKNLEEQFHKYSPGAFLQADGDLAGKAIELARKSRLQIPLLMGVDAIHGFALWKGATVFPTQLAIACSWNKNIIKEMGRITAKEMYYTGVNWTFSPVLCLSRDLRWGRTGETFGEDPWLIGQFGCSLIEGLQGDDMSSNEHVMACAKHYAGYSETQGGRDATESDAGVRKLKSYFLPPFQAAVNCEVGSFMTGYQSMEGLPSTANKWLLRKNLKEDWDFKGIVVTDWNNVGSMVNGQKICDTYKEAAALAIQAGNDLIMSTPEFYQGCLDAIHENILDESLVDEAVKRVLRCKFNLGLFENDRMPDLAKAQEIIGCNEHRKVALQAAHESIVLLKNDNILPLNKSKINKIALVGPNADNILNQCGDWSHGSGQAGLKTPHPHDTVITALDGLKQVFPGDIVYAPGCSIVSDDISELSDAEEAINSSEITVAVVGDCNELWGENKSTATLELQGGQQELLYKLKDSNKPYIIVLISSKPLIIPDAVRNKASAIIQQFCPGMLGGQALAETLFGDNNPSGRLTISFPYHVGQQPVYYSQVRGQHGERYADMTQEPLYPFGYGLSYSEVKYESVEINKEKYNNNEKIKIKVRISNQSSYSCIEVIQAYISDNKCSATWVDSELKGFARVELDARETREIEINIPTANCSIVDVNANRIVEPGSFELRIGKSAKDILFKIPFIIE
jgi:beta-glucosidase